MSSYKLQEARVCSMAAKVQEEKIKFMVEEHSTSNTVALIVTGSLKDVGEFAAKCARDFHPMKFNTQVVSRRPLNEDSTRVEWIITRNKRDDETTT